MMMILSSTLWILLHPLMWWEHKHIIMFVHLSPDGFYLWAIVSFIAYFEHALFYESTEFRLFTLSFLLSACSFITNPVEWDVQNNPSQSRLVYSALMSLENVNAISTLVDSMNCYCVILVLFGAIYLIISKILHQIDGNKPTSGTFSSDILLKWFVKWQMAKARFSCRSLSILFQTRFSKLQFCIRTAAHKMRKKMNQMKKDRYGERE